MPETGLKVLMITSELEPFAKIGGLADMVGALAAELGGLGLDVRVVLPRYDAVDIGRLRRIGDPLAVPVGSRTEWCAVYTSMLPGTEVPVYFLDNEDLYGRAGIYGSRIEPGFQDNLQRFTALCRGALELAEALDWSPDVIHGHDWPAALAAVLLRISDADGPFARTASVHSLHVLEGGAEVLEVVASSAAPIVGKPLRRLSLPKGSLLAAIVRGEDVIVPRGDDEVMPGDRVIVMATGDARPTLERLFRGRRSV